MTTLGQSLLVVGAIVLGQALPAPAQAKPKTSQKSVDVAKIKAALESGDEQRMLDALETVAAAGDAGKAAAPPIEGLLRRGASVKVLVRAIDVCGALKQESSSAALAPYYRHRVPDVRRAAVKAPKPAVPSPSSPHRRQPHALPENAASALNTPTRIRQ